jgi:hypothetical protein
MGGSGGYFDSDPGKVAKYLRDSGNATRTAKFSVEVGEIIRVLSSQFNGRDREAINLHLETIEAAIEKDIEGSVNVRFGGSVAKHTHVDGISDVDALVFIDNCELSDGTPEEAREYLAKRLRERFSATDVHEGQLAVTVQFSDAEVQIIPAIRCNASVKISDETGKEWSKIKPAEFTNLLTEVNNEAGGKVIPIIKLAKSIMAQQLKTHHMSGYHTEALAVDIFKAYSGPSQPKSMVKHFFEEASTRVLSPIADRTGQSTHVDEYLGDANSLPRQILANGLSRIARKMNNADRTESLDTWKEILDNER